MRGAERDRYLLELRQIVSRPRRWLLLQTAYTGEARRAVVGRLPFAPGSLIYDLGSGFGAMSLELAEHFAAPVVGWDLDEECLAVAGDLARAIPALRGQVAFRRGDVTQLPRELPRPQAAVARFLLQHLPEPARAVASWAEVLQPGGYLFLEDVDDGYTCQYPPPPQPWQRLLEAFSQLQALRGGDRQIGRKLAHLCLHAGLRLLRVECVPWAIVRRESLDDPAVAFERERVVEEKAALLEAGLVTPAEFEQGVAAFAAAFPRVTYLSTATVQVLAQKL
jgi:SAM-dependent methyltransferase